MSFIPEDEIKGKGANYLAPMIDFLFLMLVFFASLAVSRVTTKDTEIELVKIKPENAPSLVSKEEEESKIVNITVTESGTYKWVTEFHDYRMEDAQSIAEELSRQYERGLLPEDKLKTLVMLKVDKEAKWQPILEVIFAIRDSGFEVRPVYEPDEESQKQTVHLETLGGTSL